MWSCSFWTQPQKVVGYHRETHHFREEKSTKELTVPQHTRFILPLTSPDKIIATLRGRYFSFMVTCRGGGPSILLTQDRSVAQKPHWGFHCCATAAFCFPKKQKIRTLLLLRKGSDFHYLVRWKGLEPPAYWFVEGLCTVFYVSGCRYLYRFIVVFISLRAHSFLFVSVKQGTFKALSRGHIIL